MMKHLFISMVVFFNWMMIPDLYLGNGWKSPFPSMTKNWLAFGYQVMLLSGSAQLFRQVVGFFGSFLPPPEFFGAAVFVGFFVGKKNSSR